MNDEEASSGESKKTPDALGDALAVLVEKISDPRVAAVVAVVVAVAIVVVLAFAGSIPALLLLVLVVLVAIAFIWSLARETSRVSGGIVVDLNDTVRLVASLSETACHDIRRTLAEATAEAAAVLQVPVDSVRANLFGISPDHKLSILKGLTHHMDQAEELGLVLELGQGSTGVAFRTGRPNIAVLRADWGPASIPVSLLSKVHPELRWIVSVPVFADASGKPMWIFNVDGIREPADVAGLQLVVGRLVFYAQMIALIVANSAERSSNAT